MNYAVQYLVTFTPVCIVYAEKIKEIYFKIILTASTLLIVSMQTRQILALDFIELIIYSSVLPRSVGPISAGKRLYNYKLTGIVNDMLLIS